MPLKTADSPDNFRLVTRLTAAALCALVATGVSVVLLRSPSPAPVASVTPAIRPLVMESVTDAALFHPDASRAPETPRAPAAAPAKPRVVQRAKPARRDPWERYGYDISWPQCGPHGAGSALPHQRGSVAVVGITGGTPFTTNPCLAQQWSWARSRTHHSGYINIAFPRNGMNPASYGAATVAAALSRARANGIALTGAWLDVEVGNHWSHNRSANYAVVRGALAALKAASIAPGIYTTPLNWREITGNARIDVPLWKAVYTDSAMSRSCKGAGIGGRAPDMVQGIIKEGRVQFDWNLICRDKPDFLSALG